MRPQLDNETSLIIHTEDCEVPCTLTIFSYTFYIKCQGLSLIWGLHKIWLGKSLNIINILVGFHIINIQSKMPKDPQPIFRVSGL